MHFHHCFFNCPIKTAQWVTSFVPWSVTNNNPSLHNTTKWALWAKLTWGMYKCHVCFFNVCFSLFPVDGSFPNYMLNKDKFGPGQNFYVWPQVEEAPRQQLWLRKRKYNFACISVIYKLYEIGGSKVFSYSGSVPRHVVLRLSAPAPRNVGSLPPPRCFGAWTGPKRVVQNFSLLSVPPRGIQAQCPASYNSGSVPRPV